MSYKNMISILVLVGMAMGQSQSDPDIKPDVLFIVIEDLAAITGGYGHPLVKTPNIDKLAKGGVLFDRAYCQAAVCNPSRASVSTGLRPESTGVYNNSLDWRGQIPPGHLTLPEYFQANGYETVTCGKIHHHERLFKRAIPGAQEREDRMWNRKLAIQAKGYVTPPRRPGAPRPEGLKPEDYISRSLEWGPTGLTDWQQQDGAIAQAVARELKTDRDRPRYLAVGFHAPHYPLRAPDKYFAWYPLEKIQPAQSPAHDLDDVPVQYSAFNTTDEQWLDEQEKKQVLAAYYACISYVDACVGLLIEALVESGRLDNTVICLWGDHGMHLGEHSLWRKFTLFEGSTRVPFLIVAPGVSPPGSICKRVVELVDIYPTLADLCGLPVPDGLDGISMKPLLQDPDRPWKQAAFSCKSATRRSLRTERWRYTQWDSPQQAELYDHETDPGEFTNLAKDPAYSDVVSELRRLLENDPKTELYTIDVGTPEALQELLKPSGQALPLVSAHRGGAGRGFPENCIATFAETLRHGWSLLEIDLRTTKDGVIVLHHDPTLDRTTSGSGPVADHTLAELKQLRLKDCDGRLTDHRIPTLDEALVWARGKTILVLDLKDITVPEAVRKIEEHRAEAYAMVMAYRFEDIQACHDLNPDIMMEVMIGNDKRLAEFEATGVPWRHVVVFVGHTAAVDAGLCQRIHARGARCMAGTSRNLDRRYLNAEVSDMQTLKPDYLALLAQGVDIIETDIPRDVWPLLYRNYPLPASWTKYCNVPQALRGRPPHGPRPILP
jgi:uncharacterized sulfatase